MDAPESNSLERLEEDEDIDNMIDPNHHVAGEQVNMLNIGMEDQEDMEGSPGNAAQQVYDMGDDEDEEAAVEG